MRVVGLSWVDLSLWSALLACVCVCVCVRGIGGALRCVSCRPRCRWSCVLYCAALCCAVVSCQVRYIFPYVLSRSAEVLLCLVLWTLFRTRVRSPAASRLANVVTATLKARRFLQHRSNGAVEGKAAASGTDTDTATDTSAAPAATSAHTHGLTAGAGRHSQPRSWVGAAKKSSAASSSRGRPRSLERFTRDNVYHVGLTIIHKFRSTVFDLASGVLGLFVALVTALVWCISFPSMLTLPVLLWTLVVMTWSKLTRSYTPVFLYLAFLIVAEYAVCVVVSWRTLTVWTQLMANETASGVADLFGTASRIVGLTPTTAPYGRLLAEFGLLVLFGMVTHVSGMKVWNQVARGASGLALMKSRSHATINSVPSRSTVGSSVSSSHVAATDGAAPHAHTFVELARLRRPTTCWGKFTEAVSDMAQLLMGFVFLVVLSVLYVLGLTHVDLIHAAYMLLFVIMFTSPTARQRYWPLLVCYCSLVVATLFSWFVLAPVVAAGSAAAGATDSGWPALVGFRVTRASSLWRTSMVGDTVILLFAAIQVPQYRREKAGEHATFLAGLYVRRPWVKTLLRSALRIQRLAGAVVCYVLYIVLSLVPSASFRKLATIVVALVCIFFHLAVGVRRGSGHSSRSIPRLLFVMAVLQAVFLIARYMYQFSYIATVANKVITFNGALEPSDWGLEEYSKSADSRSNDLYWHLLDTTILMLVTVFQLRVMVMPVPVSLQPSSDVTAVPAAPAAAAAATASSAASILEEANDAKLAGEEKGTSNRDPMGTAASQPPTTTACVRFLHAAWHVVEAALGVLLWFLVRNLFFHSGKLALLLVFIGATLSPSALHVVAYIMVMVITVAAQSMKSERPFRHMWSPLIVVSGIELLALYFFQFRFFRPDDHWYSGGTLAAQFLGFVRADASPTSQDTVVLRSVTTWSYVAVLSVQLVGLLIAFLQRWTHDLQALVRRVEALRFAMRSERVRSLFGQAAHEGIGEARRRVYSTDEPDYGSQASVLDMIDDSSWLVRVMVSDPLPPRVYTFWTLLTPRLALNLSLVAMAVGAVAMCNLVSVVIFAVCVAYAHGGLGLGHTPRLRPLIFFLVFIITYGYAGVLGWPPFLHVSWSFGSRLPWSHHASTKWQYVVGFGPWAQGWQLVPLYIAFLAATLAQHAHNLLQRHQQAQQGRGQGLGLGLGLGQGQDVGRPPSTALSRTSRSSRTSRHRSANSHLQASEALSLPLLAAPSASKLQDDRAAAAMTGARGGGGGGGGGGGEVAAPDVALPSSDHLETVMAMLQSHPPSELSPLLLHRLRADFTRPRDWFDWALFLWNTLLIKVLLVVLFSVQAFQKNQTLFSSGYFAMSLYFLYNSKLLLAYGNRVFQHLRIFNYAVLFLQFLFQIPNIPIGCVASVTDLCFSWQQTVGVTKLSAVHANDVASSPFDVNDGLWASLSLFALALFQAQVYDSARCVHCVCACACVYVCDVYVHADATLDCCASFLHVRAYYKRTQDASSAWRFLLFIQC